MEKYISVVIPNYNMAATIGQCLDGASSSDYGQFEVVVVDDCSDDNSVEIIEQYPCKLVRLDSRSGTSKARNAGAKNSRGEIIFFTDADCILQKDTLSLVNRFYCRTGPGTVLGGTYTRMPFDRTFFSIFQSVFVHYSETKKAKNPDYVAAHAMVIDAGTFRSSGGFPEDFMPILEDVEYSHRLRRKGYRLTVTPGLQVEHIFNFTLFKSLRNAFKKTTYWTLYSLRNRDLLTDSGSSSTELKTNVLSFISGSLCIFMFVFSQRHFFLYILQVLFIVNLFINRKLLGAFRDTGGVRFACLSLIYYTAVYPVPVGLGAFAGFIKHFMARRKN